jgi:SAM-dependent methyltransferase
LGKAPRPLDAWVDSAFYVSFGTAKDFGPLEYPYGLSASDLPAINVGCGTQPVDEDGWVNADHEDGDSIDYVFDAQGEWPFPDDCFRAIQSSHMVEHLDDPMAFFKEAHRVIHPDGSMVIRVPHPRHSQSLADFDHRRTFAENNFYFLGMDFKSTHNLDHQGKKPMWETMYIYHAYAPNHWMNKWWIPDRVKAWAIEHLWNVCLELIVWLRPIKEG